MPIKQKIMRRLKEEYGEAKGTNVYYALLNQGRIKEMKTGSAPGHTGKKKRK